MFDAYRIAITLSMVNGVSPQLLLMSKQFSGLNAQAAAYQARLNSIKSTAIVGAGLAGIGIAALSPIAFSVTKAAELQKQMIAIQIATRGTANEMERMRGVIEQTSSVTIFSNIDVAKMSKIIATGTGFNASQITNLLPVFAKFADVQYLLKGTSYEKSVTDAVRLAHTAQHYDPKGLSDYLDLLNKASLIIPGDLGELGHSLKYSQGLAKTGLGIDDNNMILLTALLNRLGFAGSRGGTNLIAALTRTIPGVFGSGLLTGKSGEALRDMGMVDTQGHSLFLKNGKFDAFSWIQQLSAFVAREYQQYPEGIARQNITIDFQHAFGTQGARVASLLTTPSSLEQLRQIGEVFQQYPGAVSMQETFKEQSVAQQYINLKTQLVTLFTELGYAILPDVTVALNSFNSVLREMIEWVRNHQDTVRLLIKAFIGLNASLLFGGTVLLITAGLKGLALAFGLLRFPMFAFGAALSTPLIPLLGIIAGVGLLGYGLYKLFNLLASNGWQNNFHMLNVFLEGIGKLFNNYLRFVAMVWGGKKGVEWYDNNFNPDNKQKKESAELYGKITGQAFGYSLFNNKKINSPIGQNILSPNHPQTVVLKVNDRVLGHAVLNHASKEASRVPNNTAKYDMAMNAVPVILSTFPGI